MEKESKKKELVKVVKGARDFLPEQMAPRTNGHP